MAMITYESYSPEDTEKIAREIAGKAVPGTIICLCGDLGVGKTVFTKGFAKALGITEPVVSPTFTIFQIYNDGRLPLYHFDVYRIDDPDEMEEIGFREYFYGDGVSLVEWAEKIEEHIPGSAIKITISKDLGKGVDYRKIEVTE